MKLNKNKFLKALEVAASVTKHISAIPILSFLRLEGHDGMLKIHATDLDSNVVSSCECDGSLMPVCAPAALLLGMAKSAGDEIVLTMEKDRLRFESNGSARLSTLPADDMPAFPTDKLETIGLPCADLAEGIESVSWCCTKEDSVNGPKVANVFVNIDPKSMACFASNGKQLAYFSRPLICAATDFIIPGVYSGLIVKALRRDGAVLKVSLNHVVIESPELSASCKRWDGPFFSVNRILEGKRKPCGMIPVEPLRSALESCQMVGADNKRFAKAYLIPVNGRTRVQCQSHANTYLSWLPFAFPNQVNVNALNLLECLSRFGADNLKIELGLNDCIIMSEGDLEIVNATCTKDGDMEVDDPELAAALAEPSNEEPPPMADPKVINPDDYANVPVNF